MNKSAESYFLTGCGRCPLGGTTECKVHHWADALKQLRGTVLKSELKEECKWGVPCYTYNSKNVVTISALKATCVLSFFKGSLLQDKHNLLVSPGKNSQSARYFKFETTDSVLQNEAVILDYINEAIQLESSGKKVSFSKGELELPIELHERFGQNPELKKAFMTLTRGRQRSYVIYFSAPKKAETRYSRIDKYSDKIMRGKGLHDDYKRGS